jgi:nicotinamide riboside kinase
LTSSNVEEGRECKEALTGRFALEAALERYRNPHSIFILLAPVQEWLIDDGVRSLDDQEACMTLFRKILKDLGIPYRVFGSDCQFLFERVLLTLGYVGM